MHNVNNHHKGRGYKQWSKGYRVAFKLFVALVIAVVSNILISIWFDTPKMAIIRRDNQYLKAQYTILQEKIRSVEQTLADVRHRDQFVYRPLLGVDTLNIPQVYAEYNDSKYANLPTGEYEELIVEGWKSIDKLMREIYYASRSLDDTQDLAENKEEFSTVIPAIWPIDRTNLGLERLLCGA
jgi:hypothetical protein